MSVQNIPHSPIYPAGFAGYITLCFNETEMPDNSQKLRICVLCGINPASTGQGDHIPPKSLYTKAERTSAKFQFNTVPACGKCNGAGSTHDEALKLLIGLETGEHRDFSQDVIDTMAKTIGNNQRLANQIFSTAEMTTLETPSGLHLPAVAVTFDMASYAEAISRIARGMYWKITGTIISQSAKIEVFTPRQIDGSALSDLKICFSPLPLTEVNGGTLKCKLIQSKDKKIMAMQFFSIHTAFALITET